MTSATYGFGVLPGSGAVIPLLVGWALACVYLGVRQRLTQLAVATVAAGVVQWPLIALLGDLRLQLTTDISAIALILAVAWAARAWVVRPRPLLAIAVLGLFLGLETARAPDVVSGALALRQILYPLLLLTVGSLTAREIDWRNFGRALALLAALSCVYMIVEKLNGGPLIDPTPSQVALQGGSMDGLRQGLPFAYVSDGVGKGPYVRAGGPFFNPPIAGIFVGIGVYAGLRWLRPRWSALLVAAGAAATVLAVARAGVLLIAIVVVVPLTIRLLGRWVTAGAGLAAAVFAGRELGQQGATARHGTGLLTGVDFALHHPIGSGIGTQGYFSTGATNAAVFESWLGVLVASTGVIALAAVGALTFVAARAVWSARKKVSPVLVLPLAVLAVAALSESASALRGTTAMWMLLGEALAFARRGRTIAEISEPADVLWVARDVGFAGGSERVALYLAEGVAEAGLSVRVVSVESAEGTSEGKPPTQHLRQGLAYPFLSLVQPLAGMPLAGAIALAVRRRRLRSELSRQLHSVVAEHLGVVVMNHNALLRGGVAPADAHKVLLHVHTSVGQLRAELGGVSGAGLRARLAARARRNEAHRLVAFGKRCRAVVVTSPDEAVLLEQLLGRPVLDVANPLPWAVDPFPGRQVGEGSPLIFVGRLAAEKRPELVLSLHAELRGRGHNVAVNMVGEGPERPRLEIQALAAGLDPAQCLAGARLVSASTYRATGVLILPSDFEAFPMVLLEAASQGMPAVATAAGPGVQWIASMTGSVKVVPIGDVAALADAVQAWWTETPGQVSYRAAQTRTALLPLGREQIVGRWLALIRDRMPAVPVVADPAVMAGTRLEPG